MRSDQKVHEDVEHAAHVDRFARFFRDGLAQVECAQQLQQLQYSRLRQIPRQGADKIDRKPAVQVPVG